VHRLADTSHVTCAADEGRPREKGSAHDDGLGAELKPSRAADTTLALLALFLSLSLFPFLAHSLTLSFPRADGRTTTIAVTLEYVTRGLHRGGTAVYYRHLASRQRRRRHVVRSTRVVNVNAMTACVRMCVCVCVCLFSAFSPLDPRRRPRSPLPFRSVPFRFVSFRGARMHARTHRASTYDYVCVYVYVSYARSTRRRGPFSFAFLVRRARSGRVTASESRDLSALGGGEQEAHRRSRTRRSCVLGSPHPAAMPPRAHFAAGRSLSLSEIRAEPRREKRVCPGSIRDEDFLFTRVRMFLYFYQCRSTSISI
jgi:hypothetical protein